MKALVDVGLRGGSQSRNGCEADRRFIAADGV